MATTTIRALINEYLVAFGNITAAEHNSIETEICNELDELDTSVTNLENTIVSLSPKNIGFISGLDINGSSGSLTVGGNIESASVISGDGQSTITVNLANEMEGTDYEVWISPKSNGNILIDSQITIPVYQIVTETQFKIIIKEFSGGVQNLKLNIRTYE